MPLGSRKGLVMTAVLLAGPAMAQDVPHVMAGLWESAIQIKGVALGSMQMCMDGSPATMAANLRARANRPRPSVTCDKPIVTPVPGGHRTEVTCTVDGRVSHDIMVLTGDMQTHMHADATVRTEGQPEVTTSMDMRRTGECPADMKPGDTRAHMDPDAIAGLASAFGGKPPKPEAGQ
jgi:hypothetical protein